jgi:UDP-N-acetylmuramoylalanine--D-glutamate ligase
MAATLAKVPKQHIISILKSFTGLEHRLELVRTARGVQYYDDSFSTTPETAEAAIEAFENSKILILGGSSKNSDFTRLGELISKTESIKAIIGIGEEWERIKAQIPNSKFQIPVIEDCKTMEEIVKKAAELGEPGDVVLLSPACASFDMFTDYRDRGNQFKQAVSTL